MKANHPVQNLYTKRASLYEQLFIHFLGWGRELETFFQRSNYIRPDMKMLDAGCGTGIITRVIYQLAREKSYEGINFHAFDLTRNMLGIFQQWITENGANSIEIEQADVLEIESLPPHWKDYDLIVSSTMLEYIPKDKVLRALTNLKQLVKSDGILLVFVTKRNIITRLLAGGWWKTNIYEVSEIQTFFRDAGFTEITFKELSRWWSNSIIVIEGNH
jgi:2-polyprenyl-3-methyl-5-hydroxy-6-metoxy-1,4-benzoquinol methylase